MVLIPSSSTALSEVHGATCAHLRGILDQAIEHDSARAAVVVWDGASDLSRALAGAYRTCLPEARFLEFDSARAAEILAAFDALDPGDLVVLIQSTSFRLDAFRIRIELFRRSLRVIEHPHLGRLEGPEQLVYLDALRYDRDYYRTVGRALQARIDAASTCVVESGGAALHFPAGLEPAKVNIGDYTGMRNIGGQFPIGEVFTESRDLAAVHGSVRIAFFGGPDFTVRRPPQPITLLVEGGLVVDAQDSVPAFDGVLAAIRADEGQVRLRELGFGLNRAMSADRVVRDIGTFERMCGVHLSLGAKHAVYSKPGISKRAARHHVDVFVDVRGVQLDGVEVFRDGAWSPGRAPGENSQQN